MTDTDPFDEIVKGVILSDPSEHAIDYTKITDQELLSEYSQVRQELIRTDEISNLNASGVAGDLHSRFAAINTEMRRRWRS